jgi:HK97 family phage major capsid protein
MSSYSPSYFAGNKPGQTKSAKTNGRVQLAPALLGADELRAYSMRNVLMSLVDPSNHRSAAGLEHEVSARARSMELTRQHEHGVFIPFEVLARDLVVGTPSAGGNLVATEVHREKLIDLLRPASAVVAAGATVLTGLTGNFAVPRMSGGTQIQWVAENTAPTEGAPTFDVPVSMSPKTAGGFVDIGRRLMLQTGGDTSRLISNDLIAGIGTIIDVAALNGSGSGNQPRGILNTAGIGSVAGGANGAAPVYDNVVDLEAAVANQNTLLEQPGFVTNSRVRSKLEKTQMFGGTNGIPVWRADGSGDVLKGRRAFVSNNVPNTLTKGTSSGICSALIYGNWPDLIVGMWGEGVTIMVDPYSNSTTGAVRLVALVDCDVAIRYATLFSAMVDALTT